MGRGQSDTFFSKKNPSFQIYCVWPHFLITEYWCLRLLEVPYIIPQTRELKQTELNFLIALESESLRLMCQGGWLLLRLLFLACRWPLSCHLFTRSPVCAQTPGIPFFSSSSPLRGTGGCAGWQTKQNYASVTAVAENNSRLGNLVE